MPKTRRRFRVNSARAIGTRGWRESVLSAWATWTRHQIARIVVAVVLAWLVGATALYFAERRVNPEFATWTDTLWNVWVLLFSGLDQPPKTVVGRLVTMVILVLGVGAAGLFTASVASLLVERYLRSRDVPTFESIRKGEQQPNISAECRNANNRHHLQKAGADEIISSDELGLRLLARSSLFHGMTRVYQELLTVGRDANEMYLLPAPEGLIGKDFVELSGMFVRYRNDRKSCILIGIQRGDEMHLNPIGDEAGPLQRDDQLILLCRVFLKPADPLPTTPPVTPAVEPKS